MQKHKRTCIADNYIAPFCSSLYCTSTNTCPVYVYYLERAEYGVFHVWDCRTTLLYEYGVPVRCPRSNTCPVVWPSSSWRVPPVETQVVSIVPPGHPCRYPFSFFVFSFPFSVFPLPVRFVFSFCRFPFVSCITLFAFLFASLLSLVADHFLLSRCYVHPPSAACEPASMRIPLACCLLGF